jgi:hypothetical protein
LALVELRQQPFKVRVALGIGQAQPFLRPREQDFLFANIGNDQRLLNALSRRRATVCAVNFGHDLSPGDSHNSVDGELFRRGT